jgi:hypothetical protein
MAHDGGSVTEAQHGERTTPSRPDERGRGRRLSTRAAVSVVGALAMAVVAGGSGWLAYAAHYQPLSSGSSSGPRSRNVLETTDGFGETAFLVTGRTGDRGVVEYSLRNNGRFAVRLLGLASDEAADTTMRWAPEFTPDGTIGGTPAQVRSFPVTVGAGHEVSLWVTVTKPRCTDGITSGLDYVPVRWQALGVHHVFRLRLAPETEGTGGLPVFTCYPAAALRHVDRR